MSRMSLRREVATKPFSSALSPAMKREFFQAPKYSDIVGVITTTAVKASSSVGSHFLADASSSLAYLVKSVAAASRKSASGSASGKVTLPSPSRSGSTPLAWNFGSVPKTEVSISAKKLPGCLYSLPAFVVRLKGTALSGSEPSEPASMITS